MPGSWNPLLLAVGVAGALLGLAGQSRAGNFEVVRVSVQHVVNAPLSSHRGEVPQRLQEGGVQVATTKTRLELHVPQVPSSRDIFVWGIRFQRFDLHYPDTIAGRRPVDVPYEGWGPRQLEGLRASWTWRHQFGDGDTGWYTYLHTRAGLSGEQPRWDSRWLRLGTMPAAVYGFGKHKAAGVGLYAGFGIGSPIYIPVVQFNYLAGPFRATLLLPVESRAWYRVAEPWELGVVLLSDLARYRSEAVVGNVTRYDKLDATFGLTSRYRYAREVFVTLDAGFSWLRELDYMDPADRIIGGIRLQTAFTAALRFSWEPEY